MIQFDFDKYTLQVHKSGVNAIQLNKEGLMLATASEKGTLIRIFKYRKQEKENKWEKIN